MATSHQNLTIPLLLPGELIANWKPLFMAAVAPLIEKARIKQFRFYLRGFAAVRLNENWCVKWLVRD